MWAPAVLVGAVAWHTTGKLTRWMPTFRAAIFWSIPFLIAGVISLLMLIPIIADGRYVGLGLLLCGGLFLCGALILQSGRWARGWQLRKLASASDRGE